MPDQKQRPDPAVTPFVAAEDLVKALVNAKTPKDQLQVAVDFVGKDALFDRVVLFAVARAWSPNKQDFLEQGVTEKLEELDRYWKQDSPKEFFLALQTRLPGLNEAAQLDLLSNAAILIQLKQTDKNCSAKSGLKALHSHLTRKGPHA